MRYIIMFLIVLGLALDLIRQIFCYVQPQILQHVKSAKHISKRSTITEHL